MFDARRFHLQNTVKYCAMAAGIAPRRHEKKETKMKFETKPLTEEAENLIEEKINEYGGGTDK